jgi:hypothetical protein
MVSWRSRRARRGQQPFYTEGRRGGRFREGVVHIGEEEEGVAQALGFALPLVVGMGQLGGGLVGRKRKDREREKKERFNLASFKLNVLGKLSYMITLIKQHLCNYNVVNE